MKKITKFLDSVMGGIKRTCVAKALAVFAVASITTSSFAQTLGGANSVINGVEDFEGLTYQDVRDAAVADNTFPTDNKSKILFFYNVKTGKFLNVGGYWGTCVSLHDYGRAMWVNVSGSALHFAMDMNTSVGKYMGYVHTGNNTKDKGVFVDREEADKVASTAWFITPVAGDEKNTFKIYTEAPSSSTASSYDKMYLSANPDYNGTNLNCTVYKNPTDGCDEWRIFTYEQIYEAQKKGSVDNMKNALELSFRLKCPGFERGDNDIDEWKTYNFKDKVQNETGFAKFGLEKLYNTSASWGENGKETYDVDDLSSGYTFEKDTYNEWENYRRNLGKYYCSSIKEKCGMVYQDISITLPGTYVVECKGYSTTPKAKLFAGVLDPGNKDKMVSGTMNYTMLSQTSNMTADEQTRLHISEKNMDYAGKEFYDSRKYVNSVVLTVPKSVFENANGKPVHIRLGVMTGTYSKDDSKVEDAAPGEWTVFDDFRLQYASKETAHDLVLDDMRADLNYLFNTINKYKYENTTLHLNKKLTPNKWNSLVLPVSLTKDQLQSTFGANVRLAKLDKLTPTAIEFESVDLDNKAFADEALEAYKPYIIFPERTSNASDAYTAYFTIPGEQNSLKVIVPAGHYTIAKVTMGDLSQINKDDWTTKLHYGDGNIEAYGTFARTFDPDATQNEKYGTWNFSNNKGTIISGRPRLEHSYFFDKGNMYHSTGRPRGLRGFSCWFQPTTTSGAQNAQLTIDGVSQGTTGIEDILADYEQPVSRFANGIYNLNGQLVKQGNSTAGLPSGMYIVNGKKCIVR